jgi:phosphomevalonate kinase
LTVHCAAPGKLLLLGEYAVLEGAPAIAAPVDRWAHARVEAVTGEGLVLAPDIIASPRRYGVVAGRIHWGEDGPGALSLVDACLTELAEQDLLKQPLHIELSTSDFFDVESGQKLGLGSSAALTVALIGAALQAVGAASGPGAVFKLAMRAHRAFQGGRGSGVDLAVSAHAALLNYRLINGCGRATPLPWPENLFVTTVWTGRSASTSGMLEQLARWQSAHPRDYGELMSALVEQCHAGCSAFAAGRAAAFLNHARACTELVDALGQAAGLDIVSTPHRRAIEIADGCDVLYRPSGAGGGDFGIAFSTHADGLAAFRSGIVEYGLRPLDLGLPGAPE